MQIKYRLRYVCHTLAYFCWGTIFTGRNTGDSLSLAFIQSVVVLSLFWIDKHYPILYLQSHRNSQNKQRLWYMSVRLFHISAGVQYLLVEIPVPHYDQHLFNQSLSYYYFASIKTTVFFIYGLIEIAKTNRDYGIYLSDFFIFLLGYNIYWQKQR